MGQDANAKPSKTKKILQKTNKLVSNRVLFLIVFVLISFLISYISKGIYNTKTDEYKNKIYTKINQKILDQYKVMLNEKLNTSTLISSSLSKNNSIKKSLVQNNTSYLDMDKLLDEMRTTKEYVDIQAEVIDADGISFKRSWTYLSGDDLVQNDPKLAHLIKYPRVDTTIEATKYGMTFTNKIPIYEKDKFLGLFGVNLHFDALVEVFVETGFNSVILLNEVDSKKIVQDLSYSKKFVGECYVVNSNANNYLLKVLKQNGVDKFCENWDKTFMINEQSDHLVSKFIIKNSDNVPIAKAIIFKSIDEINFEDLSFLQKAHIISTILLILMLGFLVNYIYLLKRVKEIQVENSHLVVTNDELKVKTDELDYKQKELDNLFDNQPNLMFMHDGKVITKVNQRFIKGFFRRFGTFEGFRKKHKCVSELFEYYDGPNYICEQTINGKYWVDFILDDPRKLYKTVMSVDGDPHHFIIKLNEMGYNKQSADRSIIVALVDMTADWLYYNTLLCSDGQINKVDEKELIVDVKENTDISYEILQEIEDTFKELINMEVNKKSISPSEINLLKNTNIVKVESEVKFSHVDSQWLFLIPAQTASKLLNFMEKNINGNIIDIVNKDALDTSREFVSTIALDLCKNINMKNFHDLNGAKYSESNYSEVHYEDLKDINNLFKIEIEVAGELFEFYISFSEDIVPFINQIKNGLEIQMPKKQVIEKKEIPKQKEIMKPVVKSAAKDEHSKIKLKPKPVVDTKIVPKQEPVIKKQELNHNKNKLDAYTLIQTGLGSVLKDTIGDNIVSRKISAIEPSIIEGKNFLEFDNEFHIAKRKEPLKWSLLIPVHSLSLMFNIMIDNKDANIVDTVDDGLKDIAQLLVSSMDAIISKNTNGQVKFIPSIAKVKNNIKLNSSVKIFSMGFTLNNKELPIYIMLESVAK